MAQPQQASPTSLFGLKTCLRCAWPMGLKICLSRLLSSGKSDPATLPRRRVSRRRLTFPDWMRNKVQNGAEHCLIPMCYLDCRRPFGFPARHTNLRRCFGVPVFTPSVYLLPTKVFRAPARRTGVLTGKGAGYFARGTGKMGRTENKTMKVQNTRAKV